MRAAIFDQPALQQCMGTLFEALIEEPPEHQSMIHLLVEARKTNGSTSILFTLGSPELPGEYSTLVPDAIANGAFHVINVLRRKTIAFPRRAKRRVLHGNEFRSP